jgi:hypothetical protein
MAADPKVTSHSVPASDDNSMRSPIKPLLIMALVLALLIAFGAYNN